MINTIQKLNKILSIITLIIISFHFILFIFIKIYYSDRVLPGISAGGQYFGNLKQEAVLNKINQIQVNNKFNLVWDNQSYVINGSDIKLKYNPTKTASDIFQQNKNITFINVSERFNKPISVPLAFDYDEVLLDTILATISAQISVPAIEPSITVNGKKVIVNSGKNGQEVEIVSLKNKIRDYLSNNSSNLIVIPVKKLNPKLSEEALIKLQNRAENLLDKSLNVNFEHQLFTYSDNEIINLLEPKLTDNSQDQFPGLNEQKIDELATNIAKSVERDAQNAKFIFEDEKVKEFTPGRDGIRIKNQEFIQLISKAIETLENSSDRIASVNIPIETTKPDVSTEDVNTLGIKELVGHGESYFKGSIPSRIHNIKLATKRLNGLIIKPGEDFSFNKALGEVSKTTGYEQAFVIKQGKTILDDGGGVCQVSTTIFRTALNSGLPITERHPHSYRVSYYEQGTKPGIDATIYQPGVDFKFKNDTGFNILIQSNADLAKFKLTFDFYGTTDGRIATINNFRLWDIVPPPPALYTEDPALPAGTTKQTERAVPGAKASFDYKVTKNGEILQDRTFYTKYQAWQAVYLLGPGATPPQTQ